MNRSSFLVLIFFLTGLTFARAASIQQDLTLKGSANKVAAGATLTNDGAIVNGAGGTVNLSAGTVTYRTALEALEQLTPAADKLPYYSGGTTAAVTDFSAAARALLDDATAADMRTTLGLAIGTDILAPNGNGSQLTALNATQLTSGTVPLGRLSGITTAQLAANAGILNAQLANSAITIAGTSTSLGGSITLDTILGLSSNGIVERTAANTYAALASTGSGNAVRATSPTLVTPVLGVASGTSLALSGATPITFGAAGALDYDAASTGITYRTATDLPHRWSINNVVRWRMQFTSGKLLGEQTSNLIGVNTLDGADTGHLVISSSVDGSTSRGASIALYGNESTSVSTAYRGDVHIFAGTGTTPATDGKVAIGGVVTGVTQDFAVFRPTLAHTIYGGVTLTGNLTVSGTGTSTFAGNLSVPGSGTNSERFGASASVGSHNNAVAVGAGATVTGAGSVALGRSSSAAQESVAIGESTEASFNRTTALGWDATASTANYAIAIGWQAASTGGLRIGPQGGAAADAISIGGFNVSAATGEIRMNIGNRDSNVYLNAGTSAATGYATNIRGVQPSGAGAAGGAMVLAGGLSGDATGAGGPVRLSTAKAGTGTTLATNVEVAAGGRLLHTPESFSLASWTTTGALTNFAGATITNSSTAASGTATSAIFHSFGQPTLAAANTGVTTTDAATVYIAGAPIAGTNQTITRRSALLIGSGALRMTSGSNDTGVLIDAGSAWNTSVLSGSVAGSAVFDLTMFDNPTPKSLTLRTTNTAYNLYFSTALNAARTLKLTGSSIDFEDADTPYPTTLRIEDNVVKVLGHTLDYGTDTRVTRSAVGVLNQTITSGTNLDAAYTLQSNRSGSKRWELYAGSGGDAGLFRIRNGTDALDAVSITAAGNVGIATAASTTTALLLPASTAGVSSVRIAPGTAPSSPVDGDLWGTTSGLFARVNGSTYNLISGGGGWATGLVFTSSSSTTGPTDGSEFNILSGTVPGGTLGTQGTVRLVASGQLTNNTGGNTTFVIRVKYGATTLYAETSATVGASATPRTWRIELHLIADAATGAQRLEGQLSVGAAATATTGYGDLAGNGTQFAHPFGGTSSEDSTTDKTFAVTCQLSSASASHTWTTHKASVWKL